MVYSEFEQYQLMRMIFHHQVIGFEFRIYYMSFLTPNLNNFHNFDHLIIIHT